MLSCVVDKLIARKSMFQDVTESLLDTFLEKSDEQWMYL